MCNLGHFLEIEVESANANFEARMLSCKYPRCGSRKSNCTKGHEIQSGLGSDGDIPVPVQSVTALRVVTGICFPSGGFSSGKGIPLPIVCDTLKWKRYSKLFNSCPKTIINV